LKETDKTYHYGTPIWAVAALSFVALLMSLASFTAAYQWDQWAGQAPVIIRWSLFVMGLIFLVAVIRPGNRKSWTYFYADKHGIHFPNECPETKNTNWLVVSWAHIGMIQEEMFLSRCKGLSIELTLTEAEVDKFFSDVKLTKIFFRKKERENGYFKVGYCNAFKRTDDAVRILNHFKKAYT